MAKDFTFKQFHISGIQCGMPVSTDSILLGAWANIEKANNILDIGTGTGLLAIMCAQRNSVANITGVELEENAFKAACNNAVNSPWASRISIKHTSIQDFLFSLSKEVTYDAIICNPPYFNNGMESTVHERAIARHTSALSHRDLITYCDRLLKEQGTASFVLPKDEGVRFIDLLQGEQICFQSNLVVTRFTDVKTTMTKPAIRALIELTKSVKMANEASQQNSVRTNGELVINDGKRYSKQFIDLTKAFYLKM
jgi:tRNA1Val (adenine37-N6)-methyltransferase